MKTESQDFTPARPEASLGTDPGRPASGLWDVPTRRELIQTVATVIHNVSHGLNSVGVAATDIAEKLAASQLPAVQRVANLLNQGEQSLGAFLNSERGVVLPAYTRHLADHLVNERGDLIQDVHRLVEHVEYLKAVVISAQRQLLRQRLTEVGELSELVDTALRMTETSIARVGAEIERRYEAAMTVIVDRHAVIQILVNVLSNACDAVRDQLNEESTPRRIVVTIEKRSQLACIDVSDNGIGISHAEMAQLFTAGFSTKAGGHGLGLQVSMAAAQRMGGRLTCRSEGRGKGATFTLSLPLQRAVSRPNSGS